MLIAAACVDTTAPERQYLGRYLLSRINGQSLPAPVHETTVARLDFLRGELRLNSDNSFTDITDLKVIPKASGSETHTASDTARGTYRLVGDSVFFESTRDEHYFMTFQAAGSLVQELAGSILIYRKAN
ncbi:MAG: hypothetical protein ACT443_07790 [Gemmatimonadota bacterium]